MVSHLERLQIDSDIILLIIQIYIIYQGHVIAFSLCPSRYFRSFSSPKLRHADKCIVNMVKGYIERNNLQLELIR